MRHDRQRPFQPPRSNVDPELRDLLVSLRDTFRDAASRIDRYLGSASDERGFERDRDRDRERDRDRDRGPRRSPPARRTPGPGSGDVGSRMPLESLRDEARQISQDAPNLDPSELRLRIEAVTAETRAIQNRATDPEDQDIAAKILRALTAIVSEHRPGHVYGLARHHEADWDEVGRRAREELASGAQPAAEEDE